jgi:hypothetical protein
MRQLGAAEGVTVMVIAFSLSLIALGGVLRWAIGGSVAEVSLGTLGLVLMIVGVVGGLIGLAVSGPGGRSDDDPSVPRDKTV